MALQLAAATTVAQKKQSMRINAKTKSFLGTWYRAERHVTALFKNGVQIESSEEMERVMTSWYSSQADNMEHFKAEHEKHLNTVIAELNMVDPEYWPVNGKSREEMIISLNNRMSRIALTTAPIIPAHFKIGDDVYDLRSTKEEHKGPNPLVPDDVVITCKYSNAVESNDVVSYWGEDITRLLIEDLTSAAGLRMVFINSQGEIVPESDEDGLPAVLSRNKVLYTFRPNIKLVDMGQKETMDFFNIGMSARNRRKERTEQEE